MQQEKIQNVTYIVSSDCKKCNASRKREKEREGRKKRGRERQTVAIAKRAFVPRPP